MEFVNFPNETGIDPRGANLRSTAKEFSIQDTTNPENGYLSLSNNTITIVDENYEVYPVLPDTTVELVTK